MMAFSFYTIYAVKILGMDNLTVGIIDAAFCSLPNVTNPILGGSPTNGHVNGSSCLWCMHSDQRFTRTADS